MITAYEVSKNPGAVHKVQLYIYNRMLGRLQGFEPEESYVIGRGWEQTRHGETQRVLNCMDRLGSVRQDHASRGGARLADQADAAVAWIRRMRRKGAEWEAAPEPTVDELRVNAKGNHAPWSGAVKQILEQTEDLTTLYWVGAQKRRDANAVGVTRWTDARVTPAVVGMGGQTIAPRP